MIAVAVPSDGSSATSATIPSSNAVDGEEAAIALAIATTPATVIISDSKSALHKFARGRVSAITARILQALPPDRYRSVRLVWTPAHSSLPGNELAHEAARGLSFRDDLNRDDGSLSPPRMTRDVLLSYQDITNHYRLSRLRFPPPHPSLNKRQSTAWRQLQAGTFPNPIAWSHIYPDTYKDTCKWCQNRASLTHIIWECSSKPPTLRSPLQITTLDQWETCLLSSDADLQQALVQLASDAACAQGLRAAV